MKVKLNTIVSANSNIWIIECTKENIGPYLGPTSINVGLERWGSRSFASWYAGKNPNPSNGLGNSVSGEKDGNIFVKEKFGDLEFAVAARVIGAGSQADVLSKKRAEITSEKTETGHFYIVLSTVTGNESPDPLDSALKLISDLDINDVNSIQTDHKEWWNSFWQRSFISIPHDYLENIYYIKRYILASSSRAEYPALFNSAIFTWNHDVRNWVTPHHWNMQQIYWGILPSGDGDLLLPYLKAYRRIMPKAEEYAGKRGAEDAILITEPHDYFGNMVGSNWSNMANNFTPASQISGFFWEYFKYTRDIEFLRNEAYPFMKKTASFYLQKLEWDKEKSEYFLFPAQPYEHERARELKNTITDRMMIESLFRSCIRSAEILDEDRNQIKRWKHVINNLWDPSYLPASYFTSTEWEGFYPEQNNTGTAGLSRMFAYGLRPDGSLYPDSTEAGDWVYHFSANTLATFPANLVGIDDSGSDWFKACSTTVVMHPHYRNAITPDPVVAARLGMGEHAYRMISNSIRRLQHFPQGMFYNIDHWYWFSRYADSLKSPEYSAMRDYVYDNRVRYDTRGNLSGMPAYPFIQFGLEPMGSLGAALNEMLLQSVEGKIRLFPALPEVWKSEELAFDLHAENGFRVRSARNKEGNCSYLSIQSSRGMICRFVNPWPSYTLSIKDQDGQTIAYKGEKVIRFNTSKDHIYIISPSQKGFKTADLKFDGKRNMGPKYFYEAVLGRDRDF